ncbi:TetR/AcrR family transcriptional regulator [Geomonas sp. RF6]|uniref:TetR/AcrR family transcriptional regulator n=1 Tax=Geomonas sp. RF6 TaxID=2897342 RepID=UPI001E361854|nr:TetR/AcrR family transcriptional regulator [Geomonas sp. RF6]UFS69997.1 TetR/AcrR family transcriptional regulator [Geomonas sp. RF6]
MIAKKSTKIRKEEIIQAALDVIGRGGVRALTIATLAEAAGMSEANIYRHFGRKDDVFTAVAEYISSAVMEKAATIAMERLSPITKMEAIFFSHMRLIQERPGVPRFVFSEEVHIGNEKVAQTLSSRIGNYIETVTGLVSAGIQEGELKAELSSRETAATMIGMIQFTALRWTIGGGDFDISVEAARLWKNFYNIIRTAPEMTDSLR